MSTEAEAAPTASTDDSPALDPQLQEKLKPLVPGAFCRHRSWGVGRIASRDEALQSLLIDFRSKKGHAMEFGYAAETLRLLAEDHFEARILKDPGSVREWAAKDPGELIKHAVKHLGREATTVRLEEAFVPHLFQPTEWKKFWEAAKRAMRKDARFLFPSKRTEPILYAEGEVEAKPSGLEELREAVGVKKVVEILEKLQKGRDIGALRPQVEDIFRIVDATGQKVPKSQPGQLAELALARAEFAAALGLPADPGEVLRSLLPSEPNRLASVIESLSAAKQPRFAELMAERMGERWAELFNAIVPRASGRLMDAIAAKFKKAGRAAELEGTLDRLLRERQVHPDTVVWLCRNRASEFQKLSGPFLFLTALAVLEKEQLSDIWRGSRLHDLLLEDKELIHDLLAATAPEEMRDITRAALSSTAFEELDKRSLMGALVKLHPHIGSMVAGENKAATTESLVVSWESLEKRKKELEEIVSKKIPANSKDIAVARSYGDLRENHEFKAAKEMQAVLMRRKTELESMIVSAQGTDFRGVKGDVADIGTVVEIQEEGGSARKVTILGAWDSDPENGVISYQTAVGQALLKKKPGDTADLPAEGGGKSKARILSVRPYVT
jgi:transcription elongation GreA/GreB family factor